MAELVIGLNPSGDPKEIQTDTNGNLKVALTSVAIEGAPESGEVIASGSVAWTENQDAAQVLSISLPAEQTELYEVYIRNGSNTVDLYVDIGNAVKLYPDATSPTTNKSCTMTDTTNTVTSTAHGLSIGDIIRFTGTTGGVATTTDYFVITVATVDTFQFATTRGGTAFEITADGSNVFFIAEEFFPLATASLTVPKFAAATSTVSRAGVRAIVVTGWLQGESGQLRFHKSAVTAPAFEAHVTVRRV